jgi:peptide/nickel transport system permease protein
MTGYIIRRILYMIPILWLVTLVLFVLMRMTPGDPVRNEFGLEVEQETIDARRKELGLDRPIAIQYLDWVGRMFQGDFGRSVRARRPVLDEMKERLPATLELAILGTFLTFLIAVPVGVLAALYPTSLFAKVTTTLTLASIALPGFFFSTMLVFFLTYKWRVFETPRYVPFSEDPIKNLQNIILPTIAVSYATTAVFIRFIRASVLEAISQDYIRTARAKGLSARTVVVRHAFRNALIPIITLAGGTPLLLWTGIYITERIFNWPGMGRLTTTALLNKDYPVVQASIFFVVISVCLANLLVDLLYGVADPRISYVRRR